MPNQRDPQKTLVNFWVTYEEKELMLKDARKAGLNLSDWVKKACRNQLDHTEPKHAKN